MHVHIQPPVEEGAPAVATIGGERFPLAGYAMEPGEDGAVIVSLVFTPDSLAVGNPPERPAAKTGSPVKVWGSPGPDPRVGLSPMTEAIAAQIAANAERAAQ